MTTLIINGKDQHEIVTHEGQTLLDVLLAAQQKYWNESASIARLAIDGNDMVPIDEKALADMPADAQKMEVWIEAGEGARSLAEILTEASNYLGHLEAGLEELASRIRVKGDTESYKMLRDGLDGLSQIVELVGLAQPGEDNKEKQQAFRRFLEDLGEKCQEMTEAQESKDPTLIADILEYELVESVRDLHEQVNALKEGLP